MSFELAAVIVVAALAVLLGLVCYHLLGRLEMLEQSVQGGLQPPSTRLSREQFERRFRTAHARASLATELGTGLLLVVGNEHVNSELAKTVAHLPRTDLVHVRTEPELTQSFENLGITTTPFLFVVDQGMVRAAQPLISGQDLVQIMADFA